MYAINDETYVKFLVQLFCILNTFLFHIFAVQLEFGDEKNFHSHINQIK